MDLSFSLNPQGKVSDARVSLSDIRAAADQRRTDYAAMRFDDDLPTDTVRRKGTDWVHILACRIAPDQSGPVDETPLGGSFNPLIARQLMVGEV